MADAERLSDTAVNRAQHDGAAQTRSAEHALRAYLQAKQELAARVRSALGLLRVRGTKGRVDRCQELLVKLAEDRFNLVVLGLFKRGKSSLMNAIIGRELLPTGLLPLTSVVTMLRFGPTERLLLTRDESWVEEAPISRLPDWQRHSSAAPVRLYVMPARLVRSSLRRRLDAALEEVADSAREMAVDATLGAIGASVGGLGKQYQHHVAELRQRLAAVNGTYSPIGQAAGTTRALSTSDLADLEPSLDGVRAELAALRDRLLVAEPRPVSATEAPAIQREEIASAVAVAREAAARATATSLHYS